VKKGVKGDITCINIAKPEAETMQRRGGSGTSAL